MEGSEIVRSEPTQLSRRAQLTREVLKVEMEQRTLLGQYVKQCMVPGTDFGIIPGTPKPTLLKPGAEKLIALFHCEPHFELVEKHCEEDFERGFFKYMFRCKVVSEGGKVLAEGYGSANSREARYRWRTAKRACPSCGSNAALLASKKQGDGYFCWAKKGGCGATFPEGDERITKQQLGRVENEDIADLANTILKMAKKRALVDGAIALARCSDMFTQDVEDFSHGQGAPPPHEDSTAPRDNEIPPPSEHDAPPPQETPPPQKESRKKAAAKMTLEQAAEVDRTKKPVGYGRHKSVMVAALSNEQLSEAMADFGDWLADTANARHWARNNFENMALLLGLELEARERLAAGEEVARARQNMQRDGGPPA